jgi:16S rRNA G966 N2-methylase RsmD
VGECRLILGDCREVLPTLPAASFDVVLTDPPYPCIRRSYGYWTEAEWWELMRAVVPECMRVLKPTGSAVFILQPNSERVGRMRTWLWEFMAWVGKEWGIVQDAYWWNTSALPLAMACKDNGLRPSLKTCVWVGAGDCYRNQEAVFLCESENNERDRLTRRFDRKPCASRVRTQTEGPRDNHARLKGRAGERGGTTPFNVLPIGSDGRWSGGTHGHGASTPLRLCNFWLRYLCPPGGTVLDPFGGSGTVGLTALKHGADCTLIEAVPEYVEIARRRLAEADGPLFAAARGEAS